MKLLWTALYVKNLDESIEFYSDLCRLKVVRRFPAGPGMEIALLGNGAENETLIELLADANIDRVAHNDSVSLGYAVDSLEEMLEIVKSRNLAVHAGPIETPGSRFFSIRDPNGVNVQFFEQKKLAS